MSLELEVANWQAPAEAEAAVLIVAEASRTGVQA